MVEGSVLWQSLTESIKPVRGTNQELVLLAMQLSILEQLPVLSPLEKAYGEYIVHRLNGGLVS